MDALAGLSGDDSDASGSDSEAGEGGEGQEAAAEAGAAAAAAAAAPAAKRQKQTIDLETLRAHGYQEGPSVLFVPDKLGAGEHNWVWWVLPPSPAVVVALGDRAPPLLPARLPDCLHACLTPAAVHPLLWCRGSGEEHKGGEAAEETFEERQANREAVTGRAEESGGWPLVLVPACLPCIVSV